ncbi:laminin subunit alpha [Acrasis kona]|uniref:Laminin subunit alpha n=1 Tax=Acrasis kona TaxID=1008807 RepID=A0AAW2YKC9_9EUKA
MSDIGPAPVTSAIVVGRPQGAVSPDRYKGVLMSNRPDSGTMDLQPTSTAYVAYPKPFMPSGNFIDERHTGFPPAREREESNVVAKMRLEERRKLEKEEGNVHVKHKRWLREYSEAVQSDKLDEIESNLLKETKKQKFMETQAMLRKALVDTLEVDEQQAEKMLKTNKSNLIKTTTTLKQAVHEANKSKNKKIKEKPVWAMSEKEAEEVEDKEVDDLLNFASNLDFEKFMEDEEVKEAVNVIKTRVKELEGEVMKEEKEEENLRKIEAHEQLIQDRLQRAQERAAERANLEDDNMSVSSGSVYHEQEWNSSTKTTKDEKDKINAMKVAENIIKNDSNIGRVHSKSSLSNVLDNARSETSSVSSHSENKKIKELMSELSALQTGLANRAHVVPIMTHDHNHQKEAVPSQVGNDGHRVLVKLKKDKDYVQNLPYLYRCPSI